MAKLQVMKTLDNKNVFKVADISQIIVCSTDDKSRSEPSAESKESEQKRTAASNPPSPTTTGEGAPAIDEDECFQWPDGLCPPLKDVRERRFRKIKKKKFLDAPDVESELKRLLRLLNLK